MTQGSQMDKTESPRHGIHWYSLFTFITPGQIPLLCGGIVVSIAAGGVQPIAGYFVGKIFGAISGYGDAGDYARMKETVRLNCICLCILALISWALQILVTAAWMIFGQLQSRGLRRQVFDALLKKDIAWFDMKEGGVQAVLVRLQTQINDIQEGLSYPLPAIIEDFALCLASLTVAMTTSWKLTLVTLSVFPFLSLPPVLISTKLNQAVSDFQENLKAAAKSAMGTIQSIDTVKCFNAEMCEFQRYADAMKSSLNPWTRASRLMSIMASCGQFFYYSIFIVAFWYGNHMVTSQQAAAVDVVTTFWAAFSAMGTFGSIMPNFMEMKTGQVSAALLLDLILENQDLHTGKYAFPGRGIAPKKCHGDIIFKDVSFHYPSRPGALILDKVSLSIEAGKLTFIVGPSGAGKSTIGSLLVGFYRASSGTITLDRTIIDDLSLSWLSENITLVQQKTVLFKESLLRNIALCSRKSGEASLPDILECIRFASLNEVIQHLPYGLHTHVGLGGTSLSGGEAQRVALARARLRDSPILILDESTSALDFTTKTAIMKEIRDWRRGKTTIVITHDLTTINDDDIVYVMENGKITKREGSHGMNQFLKVAARSQEGSAITSPAVSTCCRSLRMNRDDILDNSYLHYWRFSQHGVPTTPFTTTTLTTTSRSDNRSPIPTESAGQTRRRRLRQVKARSAIASPTSRPASLYNVFRNSGVPFERDPETTRLEKISRFLGEPIGHYNSRSPSLDIRRRVHCSPKTPLMSGGANILTPQTSRTFPAPRQVSSDEEYMSLAQIMKTIPVALDARYKVVLWLAFLCVAIHAATTPIFSHLFGQLLGSFSDNSHSTTEAKIWSVSIIGVAAADAAAYFWVVYLFEYIAAIWVNKYRGDAMYGILRQPKDWFESEANKVASLSMTLDQYAEEMKGLFSRCASSIFAGLLILVVGTVWSLIICWKLALVGLSCGPVLFFATRLDLRVNGVWNNRYNLASEAVSDVYIETFADIRTIRGLALESYFRAKLDRFNRRAANIGFRRSWYTGIMGGWGHSSVFLIYALVFWFGSILVASGSYSPGSVISSIMMLTFTVVSTTPIFEAVSQLSLSQQSASRLLQLASLPRNESHEYQGSSLVFKLAPIKFRHVSFAYDTNKDNPILKEVSFEIVSNSCTAIVGHSGSGKSTIAALLVKLYGMDKDVINHGTITLNGRDIRDLQAAPLRCLISIVPQTPTILPISIAENIAYGLGKFAWNNTPAYIRAAAQAAGIDEFVSSLPDGYETILGENGIGLSGGQAQRLAIARALLRRPKVLILDEATANLDNESAAQVKETIRNLLLQETRTSKKLTVIVITHARDMVNLSNRAIVLNQGQVVESGRTKDLLKQPNGKLRELFML